MIETVSQAHKLWIHDVFFVRKCSNYEIVHISRTFDTPPVWGVFVATYQMILIFLLPVILMSSSYYRVITALWRSTKNMTVLTNTRPWTMETQANSQDLNTEMITRPATRMTSAQESGTIHYHPRQATVRASFRPSQNGNGR